MDHYRAPRTAPWLRSRGLGRATSGPGRHVLCFTLPPAGPTTCRADAPPGTARANRAHRGWWRC
eukprot:5931454-Lingulodinium_polyedra.AAC.1